MPTPMRERAEPEEFGERDKRQARQQQKAGAAWGLSAQEQKSGAAPRSGGMADGWFESKPGKQGGPNPLKPQHAGGGSGVWGKDDGKKGGTKKDPKKELLKDAGDGLGPSFDVILSLTFDAAIFEYPGLRQAVGEREAKVVRKQWGPDAPAGLREMVKKMREAGVFARRASGVGAGAFGTGAAAPQLGEDGRPSRGAPKEISVDKLLLFSWKQATDLYPVLKDALQRETRQQDERRGVPKDKGWNEARLRHEWGPSAPRELRDAVAQLMWNGVFNVRGRTSANVGEPFFLSQQRREREAAARSGGRGAGGSEPATPLDVRAAAAGGRGPDSRRGEAPRHPSCTTEEDADAAPMRASADARASISNVAILPRDGGGRQQAGKEKKKESAGCCTMS